MFKVVVKTKNRIEFMSAKNVFMDESQDFPEDTGFSLFLKDDLDTVATEIGITDFSHFYIDGVCLTDILKKIEFTRET